jgi:hypothetical protein
LTSAAVVRAPVEASCTSKEEARRKARPR